MYLLYIKTLLINFQLKYDFLHGSFVRKKAKLTTMAASRKQSKFF